MFNELILSPNIWMLLLPLPLNRFKEASSCLGRLLIARSLPCPAFISLPFPGKGWAFGKRPPCLHSPILAYLWAYPGGAVGSVDLRSVTGTTKEILPTWKLASIFRMGFADWPCVIPTRRGESLHLLLKLFPDVTWDHWPWLFSN